MRKKLLRLGGIVGTMLVYGAVALVLLGFVGVLLNIVKGLGVNLGPLAQAKLPVASATVNADLNSGITGVQITA